MIAKPGTAEFSAAIDAAKSIEEIDALREALDFSASEFCRRADVNESSYSRRRTGLTKKLRPRTVRVLKETLRRLAAERVPA